MPSAETSATPPADPRQLLVAPDAFKGTFSATVVAAAIGRGIERGGLVPPDLMPVADGGEGTLEVLLPALGGETAGATARDPLGRERRAGFALLVGRHLVRRTSQQQAADASGLVAVRDLTHISPALQRLALWRLSDGGSIDAP